MKKIFVLFFLIAASFVAKAQGDSDSNKWIWPENKKLAEEKNVLYTDNLRSKNYQASVSPLFWLLKNAPNLNSSIYINGVKIYEGLAAKTDNETQKNIYQDSVILLYDLRMKYYPEDENDILNRKAYDAYSYWKDRQEMYKTMFELFQRTFELNGNDVFNNNLVAYMDVVRRYKKTGGDITDDQVLEIYEEIMEIIDYKIDHEEKNVDWLIRAKDNVDKLLVNTIDIDCKTIEDKFVPTLKADPSNLKMAKLIVSLSFAGKCTDSPGMLYAAKIIFEKEPDYGIAILIASKCAQDKNTECAQEYYNKAISLTDENIKKADIYIRLGAMERAKGSKVGARNYYRKALSVDPSNKDAYKAIGDMYYGSFEECRGNENIVKDRAVFLAAYKMYQLAGNSSGMANAKEQFPSKEELFLHSMKVGDTYTVGCWIDETVTFQTRD